MARKRNGYWKFSKQRVKPEPTDVLIEDFNEDVKNFNKHVKKLVEESRVSFTVLSLYVQLWKFDLNDQIRIYALDERHIEVSFAWEEEPRVFDYPEGVQDIRELIKDTLKWYPRQIGL